MTGLAAVACPGGAGVTADAARQAPARIVDRYPPKTARGFRGLRSTIMRDQPQPAPAVLMWVEHSFLSASP